MILNNGKEILVKKGDITEEDTDAIVNPANGQLIHAGGAAKAIVLKGGHEIQRQCSMIVRKTGMIPAGKAIITGGGKLPCKFVIHTVGPKMGDGNEDLLLEKAVRSALTLAELYNLKSVSMPAISSGIFGFPKERCAEILINTAKNFLLEKDISIKTVVMCNYDEETYQIFIKKIKEMHET